ncbi:hypothetical protein ETSB_1469 [cyanobacterium endosymbiont of Epithemia turgida isolate EtSB Lake Yunoko]|nr:hypothetical protein ETSB_1469 [cyanobacterium endosymbiont of Epithemia turgida isolate EtSB Lake Yunoko]
MSKYKNIPVKGTGIGNQPIDSMSDFSLFDFVEKEPNSKFAKSLRNNNFKLP